MLPHHRPDYKAVLSTAAIFLSVLPGGVNSLVLSPGHPMPPTFHPSAPSYPSQFLIVSHLQLPVLPTLLFPAASRKVWRFWEALVWQHALTGEQGKNSSDLDQSPKLFRVQTD